MQSYHKEGSGAVSFEESVQKVRILVKNDVTLDMCPFPDNVPKDTLNYTQLIDYVAHRAQKIFKNNPSMLFSVDLRGQTETLYIRIKMRDRLWPVTLLTIEFSHCQKIAPRRCAESFKWSNDAFLSIFGE